MTRAALRGLLLALGGSLGLGCAGTAALPEPGPRLLVLPIGALPGEDPVPSPATVQPQQAQPARVVRGFVERALLDCLDTEERRVVGPTAVGQIRARMQQEVAAARGADSAALSQEDEATVERYALREYLDDHPEITALVRTEWVKVNALAGYFEATWDGVSYPVNAPELGLLDRLMRPQTTPIDALSLRVSFETRAGDPRGVVQGGIGLIARFNYGGVPLALEHGQVYTDPSLIRRSIRVALGTLCSADTASGAGAAQEAP